MSKDIYSLQMRVDIFEHGVFSCPPRLTQNSLLALVKTLQQISIDNKTTLTQWTDAATKHLSFSPQESNVYFEVFCHLAYPKKPNPPLIDTKKLAVFLALQLFSTTTTRLSLENASSLNSKFNSEHPGIINLGSSFPSPGTSPRGKASRGFLFSQSSSDLQLALQFIKTHLKLMLKVLSSDLTDPNPMVSANDFNHLSLIFVQGEVALSKYIPYFNAKARVSVEDLNTWIGKKIFMPNDVNTADSLNLTGLSRGVTVKNQAECNMKEIRISNCEESYIYINAAIKQVSIHSCREVTVYISAVASMATIDKCENCTVVLIGSLIRIGNCVDCAVHIYSPFPPILYGDNRGVVLSPFNVFLNELPMLIESVGIPSVEDNANCVYNWSMPIGMNSEHSEQGFSLMQPKDFLKLVLPLSFLASNPTVAFTPEDFVGAIAMKEDTFENIQTMISRANLNEEQERKLHMAIQGYFREWMVSTGNIKGPMELVKMIDQE